MKRLLLILFVLACAGAASGQATGSAVEIVKTSSQNGRFFLKSVPYDNELPSLRGKTSVFEEGRAEPLYVFKRGFDSVDEQSNNLILSNDGRSIFYAITWGADEETEGLKSVTFYREGKIIRSYTETEINGCDKKQERCSLVYSNYEEVVDREKSNFGSKHYRKAFKEGVGERERFLSDFPIFSSDDTVYLTDSKKTVHLFDLKDGSRVRSAPFDDVYVEMKAKARFTRTELQRFESPIFFDYPKLKSGKDTAESLAAHLGMKTVNTSTNRDERYKHYRFKMKSSVRRDGTVEVEAIEVYDGLPKEKILEFFKANKFDISLVPPVFEKWYVGEEYFFLRKSDDRLARREKQQQLAEYRRDLEKQMTAETIGGVYIPRNLGEALAELDKLLTEIDKKEMRAQSKREEMIIYHLGLGTWMRNNWRLWAGSRLQKYFADRGATHPEEMSTLILYHYHDWLNGRTETWKAWEAKPTPAIK